MGLLAPFRRFFRRMAESDEQRYAAEIEAWAAKVPGAVRIRDAQPRSKMVSIDFPPFGTPGLYFG